MEKQPKACRVCGCTEERACEGGCSWVEDPKGLGNLCSACLPGELDRLQEIREYRRRRAEMLTEYRKLVTRLGYDVYGEDWKSQENLMRLGLEYLRAVQRGVDVAKAVRDIAQRLADPLTPRPSREQAGLN